MVWTSSLKKLCFHQTLTVSFMDVTEGVVAESLGFCGCVTAVLVNQIGVYAKCSRNSTSTGNKKIGVRSVPGSTNRSQHGLYYSGSRTASNLVYYSGVWSTCTPSALLYEG
jgi:hypothetical protein